MNFLLPAFGWAFLLAGPIIAFYLLKTRMRPRPVSTLLFWDQIKPTAQSAPFWRKLRRLISLLLQLLMLSLLVLALMQPGCQSREAEADQTVYLIDCTPSMAAGDTLALARDQIVARLRGMRAEDSAALLLTGETPEVLSGWQSNPRRLRQALEEATLEPGPGEVAPALQLARELIAERPNGRIVLVSDSVLPETLDLEGVELLALGEPMPNAGIAHFAARRARQAPGEYQLSAAVTWSNPPPEGIELEIRGNDVLLEVIRIPTNDPPPWRREWTGELTEDTTFTANLVVENGDALTADDAASVTLPAARIVRIGLLSEGNRFLEQALASLPGVQWMRLAPGDDIPAELDLLIVDGVTAPEVPPTTARLLIDPTESGDWGKPLETISNPLISATDETAPLMRYVELDEVQVTSATRFELPPGTDQFAESFGNPMLFGNWRGDDRWLVLPFDPARGDLVLRTAFPILLTNVVLSLQGGLEGVHADLPGAAESALARLEPAAAAEAPETATAGLAGIPLWWWFVAVAFLWVFAEWWLYERRITE